MSADSKKTSSVQNGPTLRDAERYLGMAYEPGVFDCASLAVLVQRELFGRDIRLPGASDRARGRRGQAREITQQQLARRIPAPVHGCGALLWGSTSTGTPPFNRQWHIATVFIQNGTPWLLHASSPERGIALERLSAVTSTGLQFEGFYAWI